MKTLETNPEIAKRFSLIFDQLKRDGIVKNKSDFGKKLGTHNHVVNSIAKGKRGITTLQISRLSALGVDINYLFGVSDLIYFDQTKIIRHRLLKIRKAIDYLVEKFE